MRLICRSRRGFCRATDTSFHSESLKVMLLKLFVALENPAFNLTVEVPPRGDEDQEYFQWHIRILPRLSTPAGFELGSGMAINTTMPEDAASFLRNGDRVELLTNCCASRAHRLFGGDDHLGDADHFQVLVAGELLQPAEGVLLVEPGALHQDALGALDDLPVFER